MGQAALHPPVLFLTAAFSRYPAALAWARQRLEETRGPVVLASEPFAFDETDYYTPTMGPQLQKVFFALARPFEPDQLVAWKRRTNAWEAEYAQTAGHSELRPLNLDPGYLTLGKLVLASTKDFSHRVYLGQGIFAEVTLFYRRGHWEPHAFTFADYRRAEYHAFFSACREWLHAQPWSLPAARTRASD